MITILTIFHVIVCIFLVLVVLLQQGKSADWSGAFGGGGSQTTFGQRSTSTLLSKATTAAAVLFMITSLGLTILISRGAGGGSVIREGAQAPAGTTQPAPTPATPPATTPPATPPATPAAPATK